MKPALIFWLEEALGRLQRDMFGECRTPEQNSTFQQCTFPMGYPNRSELESNKPLWVVTDPVLGYRVSKEPLYLRLDDSEDLAVICSVGDQSKESIFTMELQSVGLSAPESALP